MEKEYSTLTPVTFVITLFLGLLLLVLPRRYALAPVLIGGCYMTLGQAFVIDGLHFYLVRILILIGLIRIFSRGEIFRIKYTSIDKVLISWLMVNSFVYVIFSGSYGTITERLGGVYNTLGIYLLARSLIRNLDDVILTVKILGIIIIPLAVLFVLEHITGKNPFSVLGGVPLLSEVRNGRIRCQGPFQHSILAGTFGATALPLFAGLWVQHSNTRLLATAAIVASTIIVASSAASGPLIALLVGIVGLISWSIKSRMRVIRWGIVVVLLALHAIMKAPVWFLISRLSDITGGGGWYRSALIDAAISHFDEWWLTGTEYTAHWMPTGLALDPNSADMTNQFISQGVSGGIFSMILFIWLVVICFKTTGSAVRKNDRFSDSERFMIWALGCTVLGHVASFFSVSYFDQINIFWFLIIAMIAALIQVGKIPKMDVQSVIES